MELIRARIDHFSDFLLLSLSFFLGILTNQAAGPPPLPTSLMQPAILVAGTNPGRTAYQLPVSGTSLRTYMCLVLELAVRARAASRVPEVAVATCPYPQHAS